MSERTNRRRLNHVWARLRRREQAGPIEASTAEGPRDPLSQAPSDARAGRLVALAALLVLSLAGLVVSALQWRQLQALNKRADRLAASVDSLAKTLADRSADPRKTAETVERAIAAASRQTSALESANKIASDALIASRRAWVGVVNARIEGRLAANADLDIVVDYRNTGHEPATNLAVIQTPLVIETEKRADPGTLGRLEQFAQRCVGENYAGAGIAFPSGEGQTYQTEAVIKGNDVDDALVDGRKLVILQGCIVYMTGGSLHHSASCFFFQGGKTPPERFATCAKGAAAD